MVCQFQKLGILHRHVHIEQNECEWNAIELVMHITVPGCYRKRRVTNDSSELQMLATNKGRLIWGGHKV